MNEVAGTFTGNFLTWCAIMKPDSSTNNWDVYFSPSVTKGWKCTLRGKN